MSWLDFPRTPETEVMGGADEVDAYASAAAQAHLESIDNTLVDQVLSIAAEIGLRAGSLLDIGTGPGGIPLKIARQMPALQVIGADRSATMIRSACRAARALELGGRALFLLADGAQLPFPGSCFDLVLSNSLLHHLTDPVSALNEMARVAKPDGVILLRDLRRPSRIAFPFHFRWHGRHYSGLMKKLFIDSVRAAYTGRELGDLLGRSSLAGSSIFYHRRTHLGFVRKPGAGKKP